MIVILDYGIGNLNSIHNMLKKVGLRSCISGDPEVIARADKYILPGVGAFDHAVIQLKQSQFFPELERQVLVNGKHILGICLGMQLLMDDSEEGKESGLGWVKGRVRLLQCRDNGLPLPHMGWNRVFPNMSDSLFKNMDSESRFYFVHSYHVVCGDESWELATSEYGHRFVCSLRKDNFFGVQFHPEKSHKFGKQLLLNFGSYA